MTIIFMDVEGARHLAEEMHEIATEHRSRIRTLRGLLQRLEELWIGSAPRQYISLQEEALLNLEKLANDIEGLASDLEEEIARYEAMDRHLDGGGGGGSSGFWGP